MKLLTKAWYRTMQDSGLGVQLRADERAAEKSEALFQALREEKLSEWLENRREMCADFDEIYDEAAERRSFEALYLDDLEEFQNRIPERILKKVADVRVLALGYCTREVFEDLKAYREWCRTWIERTIEEAWNLRKAQGLAKDWADWYSLHDSLLLSLNREGEDLLAEFEREDPVQMLEDIRENDPELLEEMGEEEFLFPEIKGIRFRDAKILKQEGPIENAWWLYDEIWKREEGTCEVHALLWQENDVFELTILCREPELIWTVEPKTE